MQALSDALTLQEHQLLYSTLTSKMTSLSDIIKYQSEQINKEKQKQHELNQLQKYANLDDVDVEVNLNDHDETFYKMYLKADGITSELKEILNMSIITDNEIDLKNGGVHVECDIDYTPPHVTSVLRRIE